MQLVGQGRCEAARFAKGVLGASKVLVAGDDGALGGSHPCLAVSESRRARREVHPPGPYLLGERDLLPRERAQLAAERFEPLGRQAQLVTQSPLAIRGHLQTRPQLRVLYLALGALVARALQR